MKKANHRYFPAAGLLAAALVAIAGIGCGSTKVTSQTNTSTGQQLMDLEKAHRDGIIDDKEYERLRKKIVKEND